MSKGGIFKSMADGILRTPMLGRLGPVALHGAQYALGLHQREVVSFAQPERAAEARRIREIITGFPTQTVGVDEAYQIRNAVLATRDVPGLLAEVGVFRGGTARVICEAKGDRELHLFDTFEGLPATTAIDTGFRQGEYACSLEAVQQYLAGCQDVHFHQGLFPGTGASVSEERFAFVHLDVDLHESTLAALRFFYPRMSVGAMLISHDFVEFPAVRQAFEEAFAGIAQPVLELTGNQCLVVKVAPTPAG